MVEGKIYSEINKICWFLIYILFTDFIILIFSILTKSLDLINLENCIFTKNPGMQYILRTFLAVLILGLFLVSCKNEEKETSEDLSVETESSADLPSFVMVNAANEKVNLHDYKGKKLFVNLWATWCPPCRAELPSIQKLYNHTDRDQSEFIMLSLDESFQSALFYFSQEKFSFPAFHPAQNLPELFNVRGIPVTFIFDENGKLIHRKDGSDNYDTEKYREIMGGK